MDGQRELSAGGGRDVDRFFVATQSRAGLAGELV